MEAEARDGGVGLRGSERRLGAVEEEGAAAVEALVDELDVDDA